MEPRLDLVVGHITPDKKNLAESSVFVFGKGHQSHNFCYSGYHYEHCLWHGYYIYSYRAVCIYIPPSKVQSRKSIGSVHINSS